mmetsp:Transcript_6500/g.17751  ORF Transcript_6500/g.17751 Transcript_6500/m.17751 type:complete len:203 (+) Transcript_6500:495-1103(+)
MPPVCRSSTTQSTRPCAAPRALAAGLPPCGCSSSTARTSTRRTCAAGRRWRSCAPRDREAPSSQTTLRLRRSCSRPALTPCASTPPGAPRSTRPASPATAASWGCCAAPASRRRCSSPAAGRRRRRGARAAVRARGASACPVVQTTAQMARRHDSVSAQFRPGPLQARAATPALAGRNPPAHCAVGAGVPAAQMTRHPPPRT